MTSAGFAIWQRCAISWGRPSLHCAQDEDPIDMWRRHPDNDSPEAWDDLLSTMEVLVNIAEEFGLELAVEPEPANVISDAVKARQLLDTMRTRG